MYGVIIWLSVLSTLPTEGEIALVQLAPTEASCAELSAPAGDIEQALRERGFNVLSPQVVAERLYAGALPPDGGAHLAKAQAAFQRARAAYAEFDVEAALRHGTQALEELLRVPQLTGPHHRLRRDLRLFLAAAAASLDEPERAREHFERILIDEPTLQLDPGRYAPKVRDALVAAQKTIGQLPRGDLSVTSKPAGAKVLLNGREIGTTPLRTAGQIPHGRYQLGLLHGASDTFVRVVTISAETASVAVSHVGLEVAARDGGCMLGSAAPMHTSAKLGDRIGVPAVLYLRSQDEGDRRYLVGGAVDVDSQSELRQGRLLIEPEQRSPERVAALGWFLATAETPQPIPATMELRDLESLKTDAATDPVLLARALEAAASPPPPPPEPWYEQGWVWGTAAGVVAAVTAAIVIGVVVSQPDRPEDDLRPVGDF